MWASFLQKVLTTVLGDWVVDIDEKKLSGSFLKRELTLEQCSLSPKLIERYIFAY
jgi:hypothetical protein